MVRNLALPIGESTLANLWLISTLESTAKKAEVTPEELPEVDEATVGQLSEEVRSPSHCILQVLVTNCHGRLGRSTQPS